MSLIFFAILPFLFIFSFIVFFKLPALKAMPIAFLITLTIVLIFWQVDLLLISASVIKGIMISLEIILIIFSAVWMVAILQEKNEIKAVRNFIISISPDVRIQAIIIAWLFGSLIEGIAGFGTPVALVAPILVSLGFPAITSVISALIANSAAVSFGAAGTPILFGLGKLGFESQLLKEVYQTAAFFHLIASIIIPITIVYLVISLINKENKIRNMIETIPFIILSWISFIVPYYLTAIFIGPELPSIMGGFTSVIVVSFASHFKILTPRNTLSMLNKKNKLNKLEFKPTLLGILPYALIIIFLTLSRTIPIIKNYLSNFIIKWSILNTGIIYQFQPFYTPAFFIILSTMIFILISDSKKIEIKGSFVKTINRIKKPAITLIFALAFVQLLIITQENNLNISSIPILIADSLSNISKEFFIFISPIIGIFGAFITGSNTLSNFLFGTVQSQTAISLGISQYLVLALQVVGGAIGNMIAIHNILAASTTVGLQNKEWKIIRKTILVALVYALIVSISAFFFYIY